MSELVGELREMWQTGKPRRNRLIFALIHSLVWRSALIFIMLIIHFMHQS